MRKMIFQFDDIFNLGRFRVDTQASVLYVDLTSLTIICLCSESEVKRAIEFGASAYEEAKEKT